MENGALELLRRHIIVPRQPIMLRRRTIVSLVTGWVLLVVSPAGPALAYTGEDPGTYTACTFTQTNVTLGANGRHGYEFVALCGGSGRDFYARGAWDPVSRQTSESVVSGDWKMQSSASCPADPWLTGTPCSNARLSATSEDDRLRLPPPVSARVSGLDRNLLQAKISRAVPPPPPSPPLAPLAVRAVGHLGLNPTVSWSLADQSGNRPADHFEVEHRTPPTQGAPWIVEGTVVGPAGAQTPTTQRSFVLRTAARVDPNPGNEYRVCAVNHGGRTCSIPVALETGVLAHQEMLQPRGSGVAAPARPGPLAPGPRVAAAPQAPIVGPASRVTEALRAQLPALAPRVAVTPEGQGVALSGYVATAGDRDAVIRVAQTAVPGVPIDAVRLLVNPFVPR